jgi:uncharacterized protein
MTTLRRTFDASTLKESTMNRSFIVFAGATSVFVLVLSTQISISAKISAPVKISAAANQRQPHRVAVQVDVNDPAVMNLALNNVSNVVQHYHEVGEKVDIEVVAFGPGLHMLRDDTSPVKARIKSMTETIPYLAFAACGNTRDNDNMTKAEAKDVPLIPQARVVKAGVVRLMELQEQGWSYLRP